MKIGDVIREEVFKNGKLTGSALILKVIRVYETSSMFEAVVLNAEGMYSSGMVGSVNLVPIPGYNYTALSEEETVIYLMS